jgi:DNA polymerase I-like protein with 3'-5' exonuclease and polymerase domains
MAEVQRQALLDLPEGALTPVLQVHDELIFEVEESRAVEAANLVRRCMEGAAAVLHVKLEVRLQTGPSWGELQNLQQGGK